MPHINSIEPTHPVVLPDPIKRLPHPSPYYKDSMSSMDDAEKTATLLNPSTVIPQKDTTIQTGWSTKDSLAPAQIDNIIEVRKRPHSDMIDGKPSQEAVFSPSSEKVNAKKTAENLDRLCDQFVPPSMQKAVEIELEDTPESKLESAKIAAGKRNNVEHHIELLSKKIDEAMVMEGVDYDHIHKLMLMYCTLFMRKVAKDDQEFISKIGEQITIKAGQIKDTYNTWPVVTLTLISSGVSLIAGLGGFSVLVSSGKVASILASNAQQVGVLSTGISGLSSLCEKSNESNRTFIQFEQKRAEDKKEEKKTSKQGTKEKEKRFFSSLEEMFRNMAATIRSLLGGGG